eukprot:g40171.t1
MDPGGAAVPETERQFMMLHFNKVAFSNSNCDIREVMNRYKLGSDYFRLLKMRHVSVTVATNQETLASLRGSLWLDQAADILHSSLRSNDILWKQQELTRVGCNGEGTGLSGGDFLTMGFPVYNLLLSTQRKEYYKRLSNMGL